MKSILANSEGALSIPLLLIVVLFSGTMLVLLGLSVQWRARVMTQKRIDECVSVHARELKNSIRAIEKANDRIEIERIAALVAMATNPAAVPALRGIIQAEVMVQDAHRLKWGLKQTAWIAKRGCDSKSDSFFPLPSMAWKRPPPDGISPLPLEWEPSVRKRFRIRLWKHPRYAAALVEKKTETWSARWTSPLGELR